MTPQPGDIGLVSIAGDVGKLIRIGQWLNGDGYSRYEHAFVLVDDGKIVEAEPGGAVLAPQHYEDVLWLTCPPEYSQAVVWAALGLVGTPYSFLDYLALAFVRLHLPSRAVRRYVAATGHEICSQLADEAAKRGGWHLFNDGRLPQSVTPGDLWKLAVRESRAKPQNP